jgi:hypothetical protein
MLDQIAIEDAERAFHEREFAELNAVEFHRELAVAATFHHCAKEGISPPMWAVREAADLLLRFLTNEKPTKRGRTASCIARYKQDYLDVERWDAVEGIRELKRRTRHDRKALREYPHSELSHLRLHNERTNAWLRHGEFECAAMKLSGRDARASAQTMRTSHRKVKRRAGNGPTPDRYYVFAEDFLKKIGLPGLQERKRGTKMIPLYNLKP